MKREKPQTTACVSLVLVAALGLSGILFAQGVDPANKFKKETEAKYKNIMPPAAVRAFLDLPWQTEEMRHIEMAYTNLALEAAWVLGDFKPLIEGTGDGGVVLQRAVRLMKGPFAEFWKCFDQDAKRRLLSWPQDFKQIISILESFEKESNSATYKSFAAKHPDLIVFLYKFPALLSIDEDRLALTTDFLRRVDLGTTNTIDIARLNDILRESLDRLLSLYLIGPGIGEAAALTYWATPELFSADRDTAKALSENKTAWAAIASQLPFIIQKRLESKDWKADMEQLRRVLYRTSTQISSEIWRDLLVETPEENGVVLHMLWTINTTPTPEKYFNTLDGVLSRWGDWGIPLAPMVELFKAAETPDDLSLLCSICAQTAKEGTNQAGVPIGLVAILDFGADKDFMKLLRHHGINLIAYLYDNQSGGIADPAARFAIAKQTDLKDVAYDRSQLHSIIQSLPLGSAADVAIKWAKGYPIAKTEYLIAAVDVISVLGPATTPARKAGQTLLKQALSQISKHSIEIVYVTQKLGADKKAKDLERAYVNEKQKSRVADKEKEIRRTFETGHWSKDELKALRLGWLVDRSGLPMAKPNRKRTLPLAAGHTMTLTFPEKFDDWCSSTSGRDSDHRILMVTLGDLSR